MTSLGGCERGVARGRSPLNGLHLILDFPSHFASCLLLLLLLSLGSTVAIARVL